MKQILFLSIIILSTALSWARPATQNEIDLINKDLMARRFDFLKVRSFELIYNTDRGAPAGFELVSAIELDSVAKGEEFKDLSANIKAALKGKNVEILGELDYRTEELMLGSNEEVISDFKKLLDRTNRYLDEVVKARGFYQASVKESITLNSSGTAQAAELELIVGPAATNPSPTLQSVYANLQVNQLQDKGNPKSIVNAIVDANINNGPQTIQAQWVLSEYVQVVTKEFPGPNATPKDLELYEEKASAAYKNLVMKLMSIFEDLGATSLIDLYSICN